VDHPRHRAGRAALQHLSFAEVIGAFYATSLLMVVLGASGWVKRLMSALPMPIVMGMVAGVFLRFGLDLVRALHERRRHRRADGGRLPAAVGQPGLGQAHSAGDRRAAGGRARDRAARPHRYRRAGRLRLRPAGGAGAGVVGGALVELVVPLAITVLVVQNGQGVAVLKNGRARAAGQYDRLRVGHRRGFSAPWWAR
jgi:benzoate membrane transport protein